VLNRGIHTDFNAGFISANVEGRTFQLFFIWLIALEFILSWKQSSKNNKRNMASLIALAVVSVLPN